MVCMLGCGRMAAMVRLLKVGSFQGITPEESTNEKIVAETIHNEFYDADEPNLLKEEDMHIFDYRPLTDPLHLVCCNTCKKPIKASQYSAHAAHCGLLNCTSDDLELDGGLNHMKPTRKGRKLTQTTNGKQENPVLMDGNVGGGSASTFAALDNATPLDASEIAPGGGELQESLRRREVHGNASSKYPSTTKSHKHIPVDCQHHLREAPAPLASKIYYSRGDHRLRQELCHLFHESWAHGRNSLTPEPEQALENGAISSHVISSKLLSGTVRDVPQIKKDACNLAALPSPDQILAQSSDKYSGKSRGLPSTISFPNQFCNASSKT
ncbi:hypothetical protein Cni_G24515 [Canna indica]|uniref:SAGA-associated factor 11 n=1 Tax=Canna indica TaxID=4628 RepID=A0AAQ3QLJ5_9LILI|nr:hypothetical protein Cni_G24515 [Canna indica]